MKKHIETHEIEIELADPLPSKVAVGLPVDLRVRGQCEAGCDLTGAQVELRQGEHLLSQSLLGSPEGGYHLAVLSARAPEAVGNLDWRVTFPHQTACGALHHGHDLAIEADTRAHATSLAAWDVPSAVAAGGTLRLKVGAKCSQGCDLSGKEVEIYDGAGAKIGSSPLGAAAWPGTTALYWAEIALKSPPTEGVTVWSARFGAAEMGLPHESATGRFSFSTVRPPEHLVKIEVVEAEAKAPIESADIRLGPFRAITDASGMAELLVAPGPYDLVVWKSGYTAPPTPLHIAKNTALRIEISPLPPEEPTPWL